jgi:hypothetical protein
MSRRHIVAMASIVTGAVLAGGSAFAREHGHHWGWDDGGGGGGGGDGRDGGEDHHCFLKGTRIRTPDGERKIEDLRSGDLVVTVSGEAKPIRGIWRQRYERRGERRWSRHVAPVRIARSALGSNLPARDLFVSPGHALYLDGVLVGAMDLINHLTITRHNVEELREIEYFHVKLDRHDVIYAEGATCETMRGAAEAKGDYLEEEYQRLGEEFPARLEANCAPILSYYGGRGMLRGRLRSAISPLIDVRNRLDVMRDDLEERALSLVAQPKQASPTHIAPMT